MGWRVLWFFMDGVVWVEPALWNASAPLARRWIYSGALLVEFASRDDVAVGAGRHELAVKAEAELGRRQRKTCLWMGHPSLMTSRLSMGGAYRRRRGAGRAGTLIGLMSWRADPRDQSLFEEPAPQVSRDVSLCDAGSRARRACGWPRLLPAVHRTHSLSAGSAGPFLERRHGCAAKRCRHVSQPASQMQTSPLMLPVANSVLSRRTARAETLSEWPNNVKSDLRVS